MKKDRFTECNRICEDLLESEGDLTYYKDKPFTGVGYEYFPNGQLYVEIAYRDGFPDGLWKEWYSDGQLAFESEYKDGIKHGVTNRWYSSGVQKSIEHYEYGIQLDYKEWDENGNIVISEVLSPDSTNYRLLQHSRELYGDNQS